MTDRQKFWLKVLLTVTLPLWILPALIVGFAWGLAWRFGLMAWRIASDVVDDCGRLDDEDYDGP